MAKFKNPFKKQSLVDTLMNVGVGGAANVAIDYAWEQVEALQAYDEYKHLIKIVGGALVGGMVSAKWARAAADGVATVGVSNLIASYIDKPATTVETTAGMPDGTIGRVRYGRRGFGKGKGRMAGLEDFQS